MNKAFTKETDDDDDDDQPEIPLVVDKNYVTPFGDAQLKNEFNALLKERLKVVEIVRWAAGNGDRSENGDYIYNKKRLREIDRRTRYLKKRIESAKIVDPALQKNLSKVFFGATVTYKENNIQSKVKIVGIDEADLQEGKISYISPVARALLKAEVGDVVKLKTPEGVKKLEITGIEYI
jgi:transcription elongation factor GreB